MSLVDIGFDSKCDFAPPTVLLGLLLCSWMWGIFFLVESYILLSMVVQQHVVILEFSQEKMKHILLFHLEINLLLEINLPGQRGHSPRARHPGMQSPVGLRKHHYEKS